MGRAERAKKAREKRVKLEKGDFFELLATLRTHEVIRLEAEREAQQLVARMVQQKIVESGKKGQALMEALAAKYKFAIDPKAPIRWEEKTHELIFDPAP